MPHKKAKKSIRTQERNQKGSDWAPGKDSIANEAVPKSASRILDAMKIREEYRARKRKAEEDGGDGEKGAAKKRKKEGKSQLKIMPGESVQHFNRRVEDDLRPLVKSAMETGRAVARKAVREERDKKAAAKKKAPSPEPTVDAEAPTPKPAKAKAKEEASQEKPSKHANKAKEFQPLATSAPKRLNDIAQAPPELNLPRGAAKKILLANAAGSGRSDGVLSMAQKAMMEQERLGAIERYRELKAKRRGQQPADTS